VASRPVAIILPTSSTGPVFLSFFHPERLRSPGRGHPWLFQMRKSLVLVIVTLTESPSVADDRVVAADGASPRQEVQRDHSGSMLSFASGGAIRRITAGVKARR